MSWTDDRIDLLKQLWTEGHSASQIADRLGGVSRNAVIGKVHRLKLESRARPAAVAAADKTPHVAAKPATDSPAVTTQPTAVLGAAPMSDASAGRIAATAETKQVTTAGATRTPTSSAPTLGATALKMEPEMQENVAVAADLQEPRESAEIVPIARKLTLVQLTEQTCKWPVGDPLDADFHFCGNHAGEASPYCKYHAGLAFQQATDKRRIR